MSVQTYRRAQNIAETPRACERRLINEVTADLMSARDNGLTAAKAVPALHRNREMWTMFAMLCADDDNLLSPEVRAGIISLAGWVSRYTSQIIAGDETIDALLEVNQTIAEGLSDDTFLSHG